MGQLKKWTSLIGGLVIVFVELTLLVLLFSNASSSHATLRDAMATRIDLTDRRTELIVASGPATEIEQLGDGIATLDVAIAEWTVTSDARDRRAILGVLVIMGGATLLWAAHFWSFVKSRRAEAARRASDEATRHSERRLRSLVENSSDIVTVVTADMNVVFESSETDARHGATLLDDVHADDRVTMLEFIGTVIGAAETVGPIEWRRRNDDESFSLMETLGRDCTADTAVGGLVLTSRDITDRRSLQLALEHQSFHDPLTGLANRNLFIDCVTERLSSTDANGERDASLAVLFVDLDDFKAINDTRGHVVGDELLREVSRRLSVSLRERDLAARLGGDEFALLLDGVATADAALAAAERLQAELRQPVGVEGREVYVHASIGIALVDESVQTADDLIRNSDLAMYMAKSNGKARSEVYEPTMGEQAMQRLELKSDLRDALVRGELFVAYQPTVDMRTGRLHGAEALVRWNHPERGLVSPVEFVPLAEETGVIVDIGRWVLGEACRESAAWQNTDLSINVNLSGRQLLDPYLVDDVRAALESSGLAADRLALEITETVLLSDFDETVRVLASLRALGVKLAIDDFGTGYSSLSYLCRLPVDTLKVDKSFVDAATSNDGITLIGNILRMARELGLVTVAEGVESAEQAAELAALSCDIGQGYYWARPMTAEAMADLVRDGTRLGAMAPAAAAAVVAV